MEVNKEMVIEKLKEIQEQIITHEEPINNNILDIVNEANKVNLGYSSNNSEFPYDSTCYHEDVYKGYSLESSGTVLPKRVPYGYSINPSSKKTLSTQETTEDTTKKENMDTIFDTYIPKITKENIHFHDVKKMFMGNNDKVDIFTVRMEQKIIDRKHITPKHQNRPFIQLRTNNFRNLTYGYYTTGNINNLNFRGEAFSKYKFILQKGKTNIKDKDSLVLHNNFVELPQDNIRSWVDTLSKQDVVKLLKITALSKGMSVYSDQIASFVDIGDIIKIKNKLYYVYERNYTSIYAFHIEELDIHSTTISELIGNKNYFRDYHTFYQTYYNDCIEIAANKNILVVDTTSNELYNNINNERTKSTTKVKIKKN